MFAPLLALPYLPAAAPDAVTYGLMAAVVLFPMALFRVFGVNPMNP